MRFTALSPIPLPFTSFSKRDLSTQERFKSGQKLPGEEGTTTWWDTAKKHINWVTGAHARHLALAKRRIADSRLAFCFHLHPWTLHIITKGWAGGYICSTLADRQFYTHFVLNLGEFVRYLLINQGKQSIIRQRKSRTPWTDTPLPSYPIRATV